MKATTGLHFRLAMTSSRSPCRGSIARRGFGRANLLAGQAKVKAVGNQITEFAFGLRATVEKENRYEVSRKPRWALGFLLCP